MRTVDRYLSLIPPLNANKPNFRATIAATVAPLADTQAFLANLVLQFDLDDAVGAQLDIDGQWIGRSRWIPVAATRPWFSWDTAHLGWNEAYWKSPAFTGDTLQSLDDDTYRRLLRAKILANFSGGSLPDAELALINYFLEPTLLFMYDGGQATNGPPLFSWDTTLRGWEQAVWKSPISLDAVWMNWTIGVAGVIPNKVDLAILGQNLIPVVPAGVSCAIYVTTVDGDSLFGFDMANRYVSGWDAGAWGASPAYVADNIV